MLNDDLSKVAKGIQRTRNDQNTKGHFHMPVDRYPVVFKDDKQASRKPSSGDTDQNPENQRQTILKQILRNTQNATQTTIEL